MPAIKTLPKPVRPSPPAADLKGSAWTEFAHVYPLYVALARQCELGTPPYAQGIVPTPWADRKAMERDLAWLQTVDRQTEAVHLRQLLSAPSAAKEESLRAFLQRQLLMPDKTAANRDKIDLLVVQYFALCATPQLIAAGLGLSDVAAVLRPVLGNVKVTPLECCEPLDRILAAAQGCRNLHEFIDRGLMDQGRIVKEAAGDMYYNPAGLVSFCRFNFIFRRAFIQLLHGDLRAISEALIELERKGIKTVDCRRAGLSASEPIEKLREFRQRWKAPFQSDYAQPTAFRSFDQLLTLRADLEDELAGGVTEGHGVSDTVAPAIPELAVTVAEEERNVTATRSRAESAPKSVGGGQLTAQTPTSAPETSSSAPSATQILRPALSTDECEEKIWEQLIAKPPIPGRSMTTITLEETRVLLSAWEVAAFVSGSGTDSEEIRRAIVARVMLAMAIDRRKRYLDMRILHQALAAAREGISRFQEQIEKLKRAKKVESAVNLGITLKRLLSVVVEAEQLQRGGASEEKR